MAKTALMLGYRHIDTASYYASPRIDKINDVSGDR